MIINQSINQSIQGSLPANHFIFARVWGCLHGTYICYEEEKVTETFYNQDVQNACMIPYVTKYTIFLI